MFLVDELVGKDEKGECKRQHSAGSWPAVLAADEKVRSEESTDPEDRRRQHVPDALREEVMPTGTDPQRA